MKKLLLTGFEPFLDFPANPTADIVQALDGCRLNGYTITGDILSVSFDGSFAEFQKLLALHKPDAVIQLGLAAGRDCVTPERIAINCNDGPEDNNGYKPVSETIIKNGADGLFSTLPLNEMIGRLHEQGLPAKISNSAGTYLCNNIMYQALHHFRGDGKEVPCGFIHLPASHSLALHKNLPSWSGADLEKAVETCIDALP